MVVEKIVRSLWMRHSESGRLYLILHKHPWHSLAGIPSRRDVFRYVMDTQGIEWHAAVTSYLANSVDTLWKRVNLLDISD